MGLMKSVDSAFRNLFLPPADPVNPGAPPEGNTLSTGLATLAGRAVLVGIGAIVIGAGAALFSSPLRSELLSSTATSTPRGLVYELPLTEVAVALEFRIQSCRLVSAEAPAAAVPAAGGAAAPAAEPVLEIAFAYDLKVAPRAVGDPAARYALSAAALTNPLFGGQFTAKLTDAGLLAAIGNRTGAIAKDVELAVASLRQLAAGLVPPLASSAGADRDEAAACTGLPRATKEGDSQTPADPLVLLFADLLRPAEADQGEPAFIKGVSFEPVLGFAEGVLSSTASAFFSDLTYQVALYVPAHEKSALPGPRVRGFVTRQPVMGALYFCRGECVISGDRTKIENAITISPVPLYLPGREAVVQTRRGVFGARSLDVEFGADGGVRALSANLAEPETKSVAADEEPDTPAAEPDPDAPLTAAK